VTTIPLSDVAERGATAFTVYVAYATVGAAVAPST